MGEMGGWVEKSKTCAAFVSIVGSTSPTMASTSRLSCDSYAAVLAAAAPSAEAAAAAAAVASACSRSVHLLKMRV